MDNTNTALSRIMDGIDIETYIICQNEEEGAFLARKLGQEMNLGEVDVMYSEFDGYGARVRIRKYISKPGENYKWLENN
jgi:hypothetical protein